MCDYSLVAMRTRLALEGEELVVYRFSTGSLGLTSPAELEPWNHELSGWRSCFDPRQVPCAVCIPPGASLLLRDVPKRLQLQLGVGAAEEVVFTQMSATAGRHRDGLRFRNNQQILLQRLAEGQRAVVLSLSSEALMQEEVYSVAEPTLAIDQ